MVATVVAGLVFMLVSSLMILVAGSAVVFVTIILLVAFAIPVIIV